jgi:hypothetical protein
LARSSPKPDVFKAPYGGRAAKFIQGNGYVVTCRCLTVECILFSFFIATDRAAKEQREVVAALVDTPQAADKIAGFFYQKTKEAIAVSSFTQVGGKTKGVDVVRRVLRFIPLYWAQTRECRSLASLT